MRILVSNKAKLLSIAVATVNNFNAVRGKKTLIKLRVFMCHEYNRKRDGILRQEG